MPLTLNIDPANVSELKRRAKEQGRSALRMVTSYIDGLTIGTMPPSLGTTIKVLRQNRQELIGKGLLNIAVFGSVARGEEQPGSDTDLLVKVSDDMSAFGLAGLRIRLETLVNNPVEIVTLAEFNQGFDRSAREDVIVAY